MKDIKSMTLAELGTELKVLGEPAFRAKQIYRWMHRGVRDFSEMTDISRSLRERLTAEYTLVSPTVARRLQSQKDGTIKYLWRLMDGNCVESVLMRYHYGNTICISSEVGCRMGCAFCASTRGGPTFAEGWNHLDGKSALAFARERHAFASGDIQRGINQMKVIDAMMNKIKSPTVLMSFSKLMDAVSDCFVTSLSQEQISALVRMQLASLSDWDIQSYAVTGTSGKSSQCYSAKGQSLYVMKPDENSVNQAKELIASVLGGEGTVSDTQQTPEKTEVFTPTADPNAGTSVEESPDSVIVEEPAESVPAEQPADEQPAEPTPEAPAESEASTEAPAESEASSESTGGAETPSISLPTQEQVESAANSLHQAASTVLDALFGSSSSGE